MKTFMNKIKTLFRDMKVRKKIIVIYVFVELLPLVLIVAVAYTNIAHLVTQREIENYQNVLDMAVSNVDSDVKVYNNLSNYISYNDTIAQIVNTNYGNDYDAYEQLTTTLDPMISSVTNFHTDVKQVTIYTKNATIAHGTTWLPLKEIQKKSWYKSALSSDTPRWIIDQKQKTVLNVRRMPTLERQNQVGILVITLDYNDLFKSFDELEKYNYGIYVADEHGVIYSHDNILDDQDLLSFKEVKKLSKQKNNRVLMATSKEAGWKVYFYRSRLSLTSAHMERDVLFLIFALGIVVILSLIAMHWMSKYLVDRIEALTKNAESIQEENLEVTVKSNDHDEIGTLIRSFGTMVEKIKFLIGEVYEAKLNQKNYEMRALQQQINPHFLYNTLSMINFMAIESGQNDISKITLSLSDFYRTALNKGSNICSIADELKNMNAYLDIQQMMHDYEFEVDITVDDEIKGYETPNLILQPIVENAIGHGIDLLEDRKGVLSVYATATEDEVYIMVEDNGVGMDEETKEHMLSQNSKGYGMRNVNQRIKLLYGEEYGLHIESVVGEGTVVTIRLPKRKFVKRDPQR